MRFVECRKKAKLTIEGWAPLVEKHAFVMGSLWHSCMEKLHQLKEVQSKKVPSVQSLQNIIKAVLKEYKDEHIELADADDIASTEMDVAICDILLKAYVKRYPKDFTHKTWTGSETRFEVRDPESNVKLIGYLDNTYKVGKDHWIMETKTKSRIMDTLLDMLHFDFQSFMYMHGYKLTYDVLPKGVLYNIVRKPQIQQHSGESLDQYLERLEKDVESRPDFYFIRYEISIPKEAYTYWVMNDLRTILQDYKRWEDGNFQETYRNTTQCESKFGSCAFLPICSQGNYSSFKNTKKEVK